MAARNDAICQIMGLALWKKLIGYHERSLAETSFSRFKGIFSPRLFSKSTDNQNVELLLATKALNKMTQHGAPDGIMV